MKNRLGQIIAGLSVALFVVPLLVAAVGPLTRIGYLVTYWPDTTPQWYGAVGDGVNNDTSAVQQAIDHVAVAGGKIKFPPGHYLCSDLLVTGTNGVVIEGCGSTLYAPTGTALSPWTAGTSVIKFGDGVKRTACIKIKDLSIYQYPLMATYGIYIDGARQITLENVILTGSPTNGACIRIESSAAWGTTYIRINETTINPIYGDGLSAVYGPTFVTDLWCSECNFFNGNNGHAWVLDSVVAYASMCFWQVDSLHGILFSRSASTVPHVYNFGGTVEGNAGTSDVVLENGFNDGWFSDLFSGTGTKVFGSYRYGGGAVADLSALSAEIPERGIVLTTPNVFGAMYLMPGPDIGTNRLAAPTTNTFIYADTNSWVVLNSRTGHVLVPHGALVFQPTNTSDNWMGIFSYDVNSGSLGIGADFRSSSQVPYFLVSPAGTRGWVSMPNSGGITAGPLTNDPGASVINSAVNFAANGTNGITSSEKVITQDGTTNLHVYVGGILVSNIANYHD